MLCNIPAPIVVAIAIIEGLALIGIGIVLYRLQKSGGLF